jgi:hypothetical protein
MAPENRRNHRCARIAMPAERSVRKATPTNRRRAAGIGATRHKHDSTTVDRRLPPLTQVAQMGSPRSPAKHAMLLDVIVR